jgi:hypothetical protein
MSKKEKNKEGRGKKNSENGLSPVQSFDTAGAAYARRPVRARFSSRVRRGEFTDAILAGGKRRRRDRGSAGQRASSRVLESLVAASPSGTKGREVDEIKSRSPSSSTLSISPRTRTHSNPSEPPWKPLRETMAPHDDAEECVHALPPSARPPHPHISQRAISPSHASVLTHRPLTQPFGPR